MPRELTSCCFGGNIKWLSLEALSKGGSRPLALSTSSRRGRREYESNRKGGVLHGQGLSTYHCTALCSMVVSGITLGVLLWHI